MGLNAKVLVLGLGVVAGSVWVLAQGFGRDPKALPDAMTGKLAPAFDLVTLDGVATRSSALAGTPYVLNFWSTWCQPCKIEEPDLQALAQSYRGKVEFFGVLYQDEESKARAHLTRLHSVFPTLADPAGRTAVDYGVGGVPETFVVDRQGRIARKFVGPVDPMEMASLLDTL